MANFAHTFVLVRRSQKDKNSTKKSTHKKGGRSKEPKNAPKRRFKGSNFDVEAEKVEIYAQITFEQKKIRISTGQKICPSWFKLGKVILSNDDTRAEREQIDSKLRAFAERLEQIGDIETITDVKARLKGVSSKGINTVGGAFSSYIEHLTTEGASSSTINRYKCLCNKWLRFEAKKRFTYNLNELSNDTLSEFVKWCSDEVNNGRGRKRAEGSLADNSVAKYIHTIKAVANYHGVKVEYSKTEQYTTTPFYLNVDELKTIEALQIDDVITAIYRDYFVLQCKSGLRVGDLSRLTRQNIVVQGDNVCLINNSHKTNTTTSVPLAPRERADEVISYIERLTAYKGFNLDTYNHKIKELIKLANIDRAVVIKHGKKAEYKQLSAVATSHMARRTFVGNLYERGIDRAVITSMSGHVRDSKSLNRYFAVSEAQKAQAVKIFD